MAEAVFRHVAGSHPRLGEVDSCGTAGFNADAPADPRTMSTLEDRGIGDYVHRARSVQPADFTRFDYILAMDETNLRNLRLMKEQKAGTRAPGGNEKTPRIMLFGDFGGTKGEEVVDPYYGARDGFDIAYDQLVRFSNGFIEQVLGKEQN